jgi:hypothetical protein
MAYRDIENNLTVTSSVLPLLRTASVNGSGVDLRGYDSAMASVHVGTITDGTHTPKIQESDDDSTYTDVAAADLEGAFTAATSSADDTVQTVGYKGDARYIRVVVTAAGTTTGGNVGATIVAGYANSLPVA